MERSKNVLEAIGMKPDSGITDGHHHLPLFNALSLNNKITSPVFYRCHRLDGVQNQIEQHLL